MKLRFGLRCYVICFSLMLINMPALGQDAYAMLSKVLEQEKVQTAHAITTHSIHFHVENLNFEYDYDKVKRLAVEVEKTTPTISQDDLRAYLRKAQLRENHFFTRAHYVSTPNCLLYENSEKVDVLSDLVASEINTSQVNCREPSDGQPLMAQVSWSAQQIELLNERVSNPDCRKFGRLSEHSLSSFRELEGQGPSISKAFVLNEDDTSRTLIFSIGMGANAAGLSFSVEYKVTYSNDEHFDLLREIVVLNGLTTVDNTFSEYEYVPELRRRFPNRSLIKRYNGTLDSSITVYRVQDPFTWPKNLSLWDLGMKSGMDAIEVFYTLFRYDFDLTVWEGATVPAGLAAWQRR